MVSFDVVKYSQRRQLSSATAQPNPAQVRPGMEEIECETKLSRMIKDIIMRVIHKARISLAGGFLVNLRAVFVRRNVLDPRCETKEDDAIDSDARFWHDQAWLVSVLGLIVMSRFAEWCHLYNSFLRLVVVGSAGP
jgi:hypothetical protein